MAGLGACAEGEHATCDSTGSRVCVGLDTTKRFVSGSVVVRLNATSPMVYAPDEISTTNDPSGAKRRNQISRFADIFEPFFQGPADS